MSKYTLKKISDDETLPIVPKRKKKSKKSATKSTRYRKQLESDVASDDIGLLYNENDHITIDHNQVAKQMTIEQALIQFFLETKPGHHLTEDIFKQKAIEIMNTHKVNTSKLNDWLHIFKRKHKIATFVSGIQSSIESKEEWMQFLSDFKSSDVYFAGMFALSHKQDAKSYVSEQSFDNYVSIIFVVNTAGTDKQQVTIIGKEKIDVMACIKSLPVHYYHSSAKSPQINYFMINKYLKNWDSVLTNMEKSILLIVDIPDDLLVKLKFKNIKLLNMKNFIYLSHIVEKLIECFKFNYRKLQISHKSSNEHCQLLDYLWLIAMAWNSVPNMYIQLLCSPEADGSLYFNINDDNYGDHSLSHWYHMKNIPKDLYPCLDLDKFICCDKTIQCVNWGVEDDDSEMNSNFMNTLTNESNDSSSGLEAYQAMQRLVSYLQEQNAGLHINHAKFLENYIEYKLISQIQVISTNK